MRKFYVIKDVDTERFWNGHRFSNYVDCKVFQDEESVILYAQKVSIGIFSILPVYDNR